MLKLSRFILQSFFATGIFFILGVGAASAASIYSITDTTGTVGVVDSTFEIEYTVDTAEQTWADGDTLTVTLPANYPAWSAWTFTVENDGDATNDATNETAIIAGGGNGQYAISGQVMTIKWDITTWGAVVNGTETIRIIGTAANAPTFANASTTVTFGGATAAVDTDPIGTDTINISAGALSSTNVEPAILTQSLNIQSTISFTTSVSIPNLGIIEVTFPSGFDVSDVSGNAAQDVSGLDGVWTATVSGQVVTMTQTGGGATSAGEKSFDLYEVVNPPGTGSTGTYTITTKISTGEAIETDTAVTADSIFNSQSSSSLVVSTPSDLSITDAEDGNGVILTWTDPTDDTSEIEILKGTDPLPVDGTPIVTIPIGIATYTDTDVAEGDVLTYQIRGVVGSTYADLSEEVIFTVESSTSEEEIVVEEAIDEETTEETVAETTEEEVTTTVELNDIDGHWAETEIKAMAALGVVEGDPDGDFNPDDNLNRAEAAALLFRILAQDAVDVTEDPFSDVDMTEWYADYIATLLAYKMLEGNPDGTFAPADNINRAEFLTLALRVFDYFGGESYEIEFNDTFKDVSENDWYADTVSISVEMSFVEGSTCDDTYCFYPGNDITRAEAATILYRMFVESLTAE